MRVMKYSVDALQDFIELKKKDKDFAPKTRFLLPVIIEENERMMEKFTFEDDNDFIAGVMLFGG